MKYFKQLIGVKSYLSLIGSLLQTATSKVKYHSKITIL
jgi:hypothetical protein